MIVFSVLGEVMRAFRFLMVIIAFAAHAQTRNDVETNPAVLKARIDALQRDIETERQQFDRRLQDVVDATNRRYDDTTSAINKLLGLVGVFGLLSGAFAFWTWHKGRADYLIERKGQVTLMDHQVKIGDELIKRSKDLVDTQIDSLGKLRNVIGLVADSFSLQVKREASLEDLTALATDLNAHYRVSYARARDEITSLKVSRMDWANLGPAQSRIAERARAEFRAIPERYLKPEQEERPFEFASICQLIGTSAVYANDIDYGRELLERSWNTFKTQEEKKGVFPNAYVMPRTSAAFFLGLVAKNWIGDNQSRDTELAEARKWLTAAMEVLRRDKERLQKEFQIPITLAEVLSYIESTRGDAAHMLGDLGPNGKFFSSDPDAILPKLQDAGALDDNQRKLMERACLIRGNLEKFAGRSGIPYYEYVRRLNPDNAYATLSLALVTIDENARKDLFRQGYTILTAAREKHEITSIALVLAWQAVAEHELNMPDACRAHMQRLRSILESGSVHAGDKQPLFFNPLEKSSCRLNDLLESLTNHTGSGAAAASVG